VLSYIDFLGEKNVMVYVLKQVHVKVIYCIKVMCPLIVGLLSPPELNGKA
jgi:hypothetical protein